MDFNYFSWLGGFCDGEGCFTLSVQVRTLTRRGLIFCPAVSIAQMTARRAVLDEIAIRLGFGRVYDHGDGGSSFDVVNRTDIRRFISLIRPHLRVKDHQADLLLKAIDILDRYKRSGIALCRGEQTRPREVAERLVRLAFSINSTNGRRSKGRTLEQLLEAVDAVYNQAPVRRVA